jgi:uncharacterized membrane protein YeaQ/YmgE (transglycosylase-associated protein family)
MGLIHILWSVIVGFIVGWIAKGFMHVHMGMLGTIAVGIVGSLVGGFIASLIWRPRDGSRFHPAGFFLSILGALLVLWIWEHLM